MEALELEAQIRENKGKGYVKQLRRDGYLPCVLYGADVDTIPLVVAAKEIDTIIRNSGANALLRLKVKSDSGKKKEYTALVRELQKHPVKDELLHADLYQVSLKNLLQTTVPLYVTGESPGVKEGGILQQSLREVEVECLPTNIPDYISVDISELGFGQSITAKDLDVGEEVTILTDPDALVVSVVAARVEEEEKPAEAEVEEGEEEGTPEPEQASEEAGDEE